MEYPFKDLMPLDEVLEREGYYKDWTHLDPEVFYSLTQISNFIKTKGYGVDVRLLIAQLAEHFGLKTTQVVDLANLLSTKHDALKAQFDVVIRDATSGADWGGEIVLARGGKPTLGARIDDVTAQLPQKAEKDEVFTMVNMGQDIRTAMTGGSVAVVGVNGTLSDNIVDGQVKPRNTSFITAADNLLNPSDVFVGTVSHTTGVFTSDAGYARSGYIKITALETYKLFYPDRTYGWFRIAWYNSERTFISGLQITDAAYSALVAPSGAVFCVISVSSAFRLGTYFGLSSGYVGLFGDDALNKQMLTTDDYVVKWTSANLFNKNKVAIDRLLNQNYSALNIGLSYDEFLNLPGSVSAGYYTSDLMVVGSGTVSFWYKYVDTMVTSTPNRVLGFDKNKKFIKYYSGAQQITFDNPHIVYFAFCNSASLKDGMYVKYGSDAPVRFEKYDEKIFLNEADRVLTEGALYTPWKGKNFCSYGDSITQYGFWQTRLKDAFLFDKNYIRGFSGSTVSNAETQQWWVSSVDGTVYGSIFDYPTSPKPDAILIDAYFSAADRIATIPLDTDVLFIMGGTNDLSKGVAIGDTVYNSGFNEATFKGGLAATLYKAINRLPNALIVVMTPINRTGWDISPYVTATKEVAREFSVPVIDVNGESGINKYTTSRYLKPDGTHPTYNVPYSGADKIANAVISGMKTLLPVPSDIVYP